MAEKLAELRKKGGGGSVEPEPKGFYITDNTSKTFNVDANYIIAGGMDNGVNTPVVVNKGESKTVSYNGTNTFSLNAAGTQVIISRTSTSGYVGFITCK